MTTLYSLSSALPGADKLPDDEAGRSALRQMLLRASPEFIRAGGFTHPLSESARLMRAVALLPLPAIGELAQRHILSADEAISGADELVGTFGAHLHAAAARPLGLPEWTTATYKRYEGSAPREDAGKDGFILQLAGVPITVTSTIDVEGRTTRAGLELQDEPCLKSARPLRALLEAGAVLTSVAHAGEYLGLISPDKPGRTVLGGDPVCALNPEWQAGDCAAGAAAMVAAGTAAAALTLCRPSDAGRSAIRDGLAAFHPTRGVFSSRDGFASSWRLDGWTGMAHSILEAGTVMEKASRYEGIDPETERGSWSYPGFDPDLLFTFDVEKWRGNIYSDRMPRKAALVVGKEWQDPRYDAQIRHLISALERQGIEAKLCENPVPETASARDLAEWMTWMELEPQLEEFLESHYALSSDFRMKRLFLMLTLSERLKDDGFKRRRMVEIIRRSASLISPWGPRIIREGLEVFKNGFSALLEGDDAADAVIWLGSTEAVDLLGLPLAAVPLLADEEQKTVQGAFVMAAPGNDDLAVKMAVALECVREEVFGLDEFRMPVADGPEEDSGEDEEDKPELTEAERAAENAVAQGYKRIEDFSGPELGQLASSAYDARSRGGKLRAINAETGEEMDAEEISSHLESMISAVGEAIIDSEEAGLSEEDNDSENPAQKLRELASILSSDESGEKPLSHFAKADKALYDALSDDDRAWLDRFFPNSGLRGAHLATVPAFRRFLVPALADSWTFADEAGVMAWVQHWQNIQGTRLTLQALTRIPEENRSFNVKKHIAAALIMSSQTEPGLAAAEALEPSTPEETADRFWLLGVGEHRRGNYDLAIRYLQEARADASKPALVLFPLAVALLRRYGPDNPEYLSVRAEMEKEDMPALQMLKVEERRRARETAFAKDLLPPMPAGIFRARLILTQRDPEFDKKLFQNELLKEWGLTLRDATPDDPAVLTFQIGTVEGSARFVPGRFIDEAYGRAVQRSGMKASIDELLLLHTATIELEFKTPPQSITEGATLYAQVLAALCRTAQPVGVYTLGSIQTGAYCIHGASPIREGSFPVPSLVLVGIASELGEEYLTTYGLTSLGHPEMEIDLGDIPTPVAAILSFQLIRSMIDGEFESAGNMLRFGPDKENLTERLIRRMPGRYVEGEVIRLMIPEAPADNSGFAQA